MKRRAFIKRFAIGCAFSGMLMDALARSKPVDPFDQLVSDLADFQNPSVDDAIKMIRRSLDFDAEMLKTLGVTRKNGKTRTQAHLMGITLD